MSSAICLKLNEPKILSTGKEWTLPKTTNLDPSKLNAEFADDNTKFDENSGMLSKRVENTVGKKRNCS